MEVILGSTERSTLYQVKMIVTKSEPCIYNIILCKCACMIILNVIIIRIYIIIVFFFFFFFFFFMFFVLCVIFYSIFISTIISIIINWIPWLESENMGNKTTHKSPPLRHCGHIWWKGWVNWSDRIKLSGVFQSWNHPQISKLFGLMNCISYSLPTTHTDKQITKRVEDLFEFGELRATYSVESVGSISPV